MPSKTTSIPASYIQFSRFIILGALIISSIFAITISNVIQTIFSAASLLFILVPLYVAVGFGWLAKTKRLDAMVSISMLISVCVYLMLYVRGDFATMLMLMVPVLINTVIMVIAYWHESTRQDLAM